MRVTGSPILDLTTAKPLTLAAAAFRVVPIERYTVPSALLEHASPAAIASPDRSVGILQAPGSGPTVASEGVPDLAIRAKVYSPSPLVKSGQKDTMQIKCRRFAVF